VPAKHFRFFKAFPLGMLQFSGHNLAAERSNLLCVQKTIDTSKKSLRDEIFLNPTNNDQKI